MSSSINDIEDIFLHIKQLKEEQNSYLKNNLLVKKSDNENLIMDNNKNFSNIKTEDIFIILETRKININQFENKNSQIIKKINQDFDICDLCKEEVIFEKNLSGLVVFDKFFLCEKCSQNKSANNLNNWIKSKMANLDNVKPIALWLMQKKNKKRLI